MILPAWLLFGGYFSQYYLFTLSKYANFMNRSLVGGTGTTSCAGIVLGFRYVIWGGL